MRTWKYIILGWMLCSIFPSSVEARIASYDLVGGFSQQANPSGVWTYGSVSNGNADFELFTNQWEGAWAASDCPEWRDWLHCSPSVAHSDGATLYWGDIGEPVLNLSKFFLVDRVPVVRFTAPISGTYSVQVTARSGRDGDIFSVRKNEQDIVSGQFPQSRLISISNTLDLIAGDVIDFIGSSYNSSVEYRQNSIYLSGAIHLDAASNLPPITFIPAGGLFTNLLQVSIQNNHGSGVARYTTNGIDPTSVSPIFSDPVVITEAREFRAALFDGPVALSAVHLERFSRVYALDDGIPAAWREDYFGPGYLTDPRVAPAADPDGDLVDNRHEYWARTIPTNSASVRYIDWMARDFSANQNPAGAWTYGRISGPYASAASTFQTYSSNQDGFWADWKFDALYGFDRPSTCFTLGRGSNPDAIQISTAPNDQGMECSFPTIRFTASSSGNHRIEIPSQNPLSGVEPLAPYSGTFIVGVREAVHYSTLLVDATSNLSATFDVYLASGDTIDFMIEGSNGGGPQGNKYFIRANIERLDSTPPEPTLLISPAGGTFTNSVEVSLETSSSTGIIRYTTDFSEPTIASESYTKPFILTSSSVVKARLFVDQVPVTGVAEATFVEYVAPPDIEFMPGGGNFHESVDVILVNHVGAGGIRYTLDGSDPVRSSSSYSGPIHLTTNTTIKAVVYFNEFPISLLFSAIYQRSYVSPDDDIPDSWRTFYFGSDFATDPQVAADADPDKDGSTNTEEYFAGTDPTDPLSGFKADVSAVPRVTFPSVAGRTYRIMRMRNFTDPPSLLETITATSHITSYVDETPLDGSFYLIEVMPVP